MATMQQPANSGSNGSNGSSGDERYAMYDEKKRKRMISNRDSARRSRMKKQQHTEVINAQILQIQKENNFYAEKIDATSEMYVRIASENDVLRAQIFELTDRLRSLKCVAEIVAVANGIDVDLPEIPDSSSLEPWQLPCPIQPIAVFPQMDQY